MTDDERSAILLAAGHATFSRLGEGRWEIEREYWEPVERHLDAALSAERRAELRQQGAALEPDAVVALALEASRRSESTV